MLTPMQRAEQIIDECCNDPEMWATHGCPGEGKLCILTRKIGEAITSAHIDDLIEAAQAEAEGGMDDGID